jgi:hypothetical protein
VSCGEDGIASFDRIRYRRHDAEVFMWAFDLIELNGDLRRDPLNVRKATLASVLARAAPGLRLNEHLEADGPDVFHHACMLGLEGIVFKAQGFAVSFRSQRVRVTTNGRLRILFFMMVLLSAKAGQRGQEMQRPVNSNSPGSRCCPGCMAEDRSAVRRQSSTLFGSFMPFAASPVQRP